MRYLCERFGGVLGGTEPVHVAMQEHMADQVTEKFPALPSALYEVRRFVRREAEMSGLPMAAINDIVLAVSEACANAVLHSGSDVMLVTWRPGGDCVEVEIQDRGVFLRRVPIPEIDRTRGHGIPSTMARVAPVAALPIAPASSSMSL